MTKAELKAENKRLIRENEILRGQVKLFLDELDAYSKNGRVIRQAHKDTIEKSVLLVDKATELRARKGAHKTSSSKGGKGHEPLKAHKAELLKRFKKEQKRGIKRPNKTKLIENYISENPDLDQHYDALRLSLPKHK